MKLSKGIMFGIYAGLALIVYFLLMKLFGLEKVFALRLFNFVILSGAIYLLFRRMFVLSETKSNDFSYFDGLIGGLTVTFISVLMFVIFMGIYISFWDQGFMEVLEESGIWGSNFGVAEAVIAILIEGFVSGGIISFVFMQYFKKETIQRDIPERKDANDYTP